MSARRSAPSSNKRPATPKGSDPKNKPQASIPSTGGVSKSWLHPAQQLIACLGALIVLQLAAYLPVFSNGFVNYDDPIYVLENSHVRAGLTGSGLRWAIATGETANWHPVTWLSHMLDCQVFGLNAWGHHLTSLALHLLNTVLVFLILRRITGAHGRSFVVAALFGLHPVHVESVAWVAERKDVLSTFFGLLSIAAYARYATESPNQKSKIKNRKYAYLFSLVFFALGLMSKPMLVSLPFVLLLLDYWPMRRTLNVALLIEKIPFFALAAGSSVVTFLVQRSAGAMYETPAGEFADRLSNAVVSYCRYIGKLFFPVDLAVFYPHPGRWPFGTELCAAALLVTVTAFIFAFRRRCPWLLMGWLWFVGTLVPVIGLVQVGEQAMADRYAYLPSIGLFIALVWGAGELALLRLPAWTPAALAVVLISLSVAMTRRQVSYWQNSGTLFAHANAVTRDNYQACLHLGNYELHERGHPTEAIAYFEQAIRFNSDYSRSYTSLGYALLLQGRRDEAIKNFQETIRRDPRYALAYSDLGLALFHEDRLDEAADAARRAIELDPAYVRSYLVLGLALEKKGRLDEAISQFATAVKLDPGFAESHSRLGNACQKAGRTDEAIAQLQEALRLDPGSPRRQQDLDAALRAKNTGIR